MRFSLRKSRYFSKIQVLVSVFELFLCALENCNKLLEIVHKLSANCMISFIHFRSISHSASVKFR